MTLDEYLIQHNKNKTTFDLRELKRKFPKDKQQIDSYVFVGLIEKPYGSSYYRSKVYEI